MSVLGFIIFAVLLAGGCFGTWHAAMYWSNRTREARDQDPRDQEIRELSAALSVARKQVDNLGKSSGSQSTELTDMNDKLRKIEGLLSDTRQKYNATKENLDKEIEDREKYLDEIRIQQRELDDAKARISELEVRVPDDTPNSGLVAGFDDMVEDDDKDSLQIRQEHSILKKQVAQFQETLDEERAESARWKKHCTVMTKTNKTLRSRVDEMTAGQQELEQLRIEHATLNEAKQSTDAALAEAQESITGLNGRIEEFEQEIGELRPELERLETANKEIQPLREQVAGLQERVDELLPVVDENEQLKVQLEALRNIEAENQELQSTLKDVRTESTRRQTELEETNAKLQTRVEALDAIQAENEELAAKVAELRPLRTLKEQLETALNAEKQKSGKLSGRVAELERDLEDLDMLRSQVEQLGLEQEENERLRKANADLGQEVAGLQESAESLRAELAALAEADERKQQLEQELRELAESQAKQEQLQAQSSADADELLELAESESARLKEQLEELSEQQRESEAERERTEEKLAREQQEAEDLQQRIKELTRELDSNRADAAEQQADIEAQLQREQEETRELQERVQKLTEAADVRTEEATAVDETSAAESFDAIAEPAQAAQDETECSDDTDTLPTLAEEDIADDLRQIKGVGAKLEQKLKSLGITSFRDLLELTDEDYERASEILPGLRSRMDKGNWFSQARELHEQKYNERL